MVSMPQTRLAINDILQQLSQEQRHLHLQRLALKEQFLALETHELVSLDRQNKWRRALEKLESEEQQVKRQILVLEQELAL